MDIFNTTFQTTLMLLIFLIVGFVLKRGHLLPDNADTVLSKLENMIFAPAVVLSTFIGKCTVGNIVARWDYIMISTVMLLVLAPITTYVVKYLSNDPFERNVYRYSLMLSNYGYFGIPLVKTVFGADALFDYLVFALPMYVLVYSFGIIWLIPSDDAKITPKRFLNPVCVSLLVGILLGLAGFGKIMPSVLSDTLQTAADCMGPLAMILTGFVIGGFDLRKLLTDKRIYIMSFLRLIAIPGIAGIICVILRIPPTLRMLILCSVAMPCGLSPIVFPAAYGGDTTPGASCALVSSILGIITIPVVLMLFLQ